MKMKKLLALCLSAAMIMSLFAGCSSGKTADNTDGKQNEATTNQGKEKETKSSGAREKIVISCYLADASQVAVRETS